MGISVLVFSGGENVDVDSCTTTMVDWTKESAIAVISESYGDDWSSRDCSDMFESEDTTTLGDTVHVVSDNLIQAVECEVDGGMIYIVRK